MTAGPSHPRLHRPPLINTVPLLLKSQPFIKASFTSPSPSRFIASSTKNTDHPTTPTSTYLLNWCPTILHLHFTPYFLARVQFFPLYQQLCNECMARPAQQITRHRRPSPSPSFTPSNPTSASLLKVLSLLANEIANCKKPKACQRRNGVVISRKIKQLSVLFEEVKDMESPLPPSAVLCFEKLHRILHAVKLLLDDCRESSRMWLLMEHDTYPKYFHDFSLEIADVLDDLPLYLLDVSVDVREQVDLVRRQVRKAKPYIDPKEEQLRLDVFSVMREFARKETPDPAKLRGIFQNLRLNNASDCQKELLLLEEEVECQTNIEMVSRIASLMSFVRYCKCILYGVTEVEEMEFVSRSGGSNLTSLDRTSATNVWEEMDGDGSGMPDDFKCPISLELMTDPVIVATGQTYDRVSITRWIDEGHSTCPKSGQRLIHDLLIPNYALRSVISQWCKEHNIPFEITTTKRSKKGAVVDTMASTRAALEATKMCVAFLVEKLCTGSPEVKRQVAYELRMFAKSGTDNRMCIGNAGAIPHLVPLLSSEDAKTQEHAVTALLNLSIYEGNKVLIAEEAGAVDAIIQVLVSGWCMEARENAAATLFSLSGKDDYRVRIGNKNDALAGLVRLLNEGTTRGKKDAACALFNLCLYYGNRAKVVKAGAVYVLFSSLEQHTTTANSLPDDAVAVLAVLATSAEGLVAISDYTNAISILVSLVRSGSLSPKTKENSIAILLGLCRYAGDKTVCTVLSIPATLPMLRASLTTGTPRARRKATSLLRILHNWESISAAGHS